MARTRNNKNENKQHRIDRDTRRERPSLSVLPPHLCLIGSGDSVWGGVPAKRTPGALDVLETENLSLVSHNLCVSVYTANGLNAGMWEEDFCFETRQNDEEYW